MALERWGVRVGNSSKSRARPTGIERVTYLSKVRSYIQLRYGCNTELFFFFSSRRRHTRLQGDWSSDVCSSDLPLWPMMTRPRSTPSCAKIACCNSPVRPAAQVCVEIGTPVAFWARADARRTLSITGVTPAVSVAHLMMAALAPLVPIPCVMSRMKSSATASTPCALKYRCGIHQTPVATITCTRERRATPTIRSMSRPRSTVVRSTIARMPRPYRSVIFRSAIARMASRSQRWGQFSCTPGERVTMCSCISVGPRSVVATGPSAVSTVVMPTSGSEGSPRAALDHGLVPAQRGQHNRLNGRLAPEETLGRLARRLPVRKALHFVDQGNDASAGRHVLASAVGVGQDARHDLGRDRRPRRSAAQRADQLGTVDVLGIQRLAEHVGADHGDDQCRLRGNQGLVRCRSLEGAHARAIGLVP